MSYAAHTDAEQRFVSQSSSESRTLADAIRYVSLTGDDVRVVTMFGVDAWFCEADTKLDDSDLWFPVIVHRRESSTEGFGEDAVAQREP